MPRRLLALAAAAALPLILIACEAPASENPESDGPHKEVINPQGGPVTTPFSPIVRTGNLLFLSGVIGRGGEEGIGAATRQALESIRDRLAAADATMEDLVKCTVFLVDMEDYQGMNEAYAEFFPSDPPARSAVAVRELPVRADVEIECIAAAR